MKRTIQLLYLLFSCGLLLTGFSTFAQTKITGVVKDETGLPIPGATVTVNGTRNATATDADGNFSLLTAAGNKLLINAMGYEERLVPVTTLLTYTINLKTTNKELNQIVVVGYGLVKKKDISGAVATLNEREISGRQVMQISDALQGAVAGVTVTRNGGSPGGNSAIRFRGITTIGENAPLIIVDGVPADNIDNVNPDDVESVTALKDNASASIYGSRAAAGVILITTKRGKAGASSVDYSYEYGNIRPTTLPSFTDAVRYMQLYNEFLANDGTTALYTPATIDNYFSNHITNPDAYPNTDWQKSILKNSTNQNLHNLSFTAGSDKIKTRASVSYSNIGGLYDGRSYDKYTLGVNNDFKFSDILSGTFDVTGYRAQNNSPVGENPIYATRVLPSIYDDEYSDGRVAPGKDGRNPLANIREGGFSRSMNNKVGARASLIVKPLEGLSITGLVAPNFVFGRGTTFTKTISFTDLADPTKVILRMPANTTLNESRPYTYTFNAQLLTNYVKAFKGGHNFDVLLGYENISNYTEYLSASRGSFTLIDYPYLDNGLLALRDNSGGAAESALRSYFGRVGYNYKNKYYLQANGRYDGSSRFASSNRWAFNPSFSGAWVISEESFFKPIKMVNYLKFRASWGKTGNERIGTYPYQANITFNNALFYSNNAVIGATSGSQIAYAVDNISWETQETVNLGLDAAFFKNRLSITGDIYHKQTHDILLQLDIPVYLGYTNPYQNAGKVSARGWELTANWNDKIGKVTYGFGANISDAKTKIEDLKGTQQLGDQANIEGAEFNSWFGYRTNGLFQNVDELIGAPVLSATTKAGDVRYVDINGDGKISADKDKVLLGGALPRYTFGLNGRIAYKGFDVSFVAQGVLKQLRRLSSIAVQPFLENFGNVPNLIDNKFWSANNSAEQNLAADYPRLSRVSASSNYQTSNYWLIDGKYLRIKNITLGYTITDKFFKKLKMQNLRIYAVGNDLFTFSKFPIGSDPEVDATSYPIVRTFMMGVSVKF